MVAAPSSQDICSNCPTLQLPSRLSYPPPRHSVPLGCIGRRRWVLPPSGGPTQAGATPSVTFRAVVGTDSVIEINVTLQARGSG
jgi:hypothetical protein